MNKSSSTGAVLERHEVTGAVPKDCDCAETLESQKQFVTCTLLYAYY
jgi:hypothetical protein